MIEHVMFVHSAQGIGAYRFASNKDVSCAISADTYKEMSEELAYRLGHIIQDLGISFDFVSANSAIIVVAIQDTSEVPAFNFKETEES